MRSADWEPGLDAKVNKRLDEYKKEFSELMDNIVPSELLVSGKQVSKVLDKKTKTLDDEATKLAQELGF